MRLRDEKVREVKLVPDRSADLRIDADALPATVFFIVDVDCRVLFDSLRGSGNRALLDRLFDTASNSLVPPLKRLILEAAEHFDVKQFAEVFLEGLESGPQAVYVVPVIGDSGLMYIVTIDLVRPSEPIMRAAKRFSLTPRETEVLAAILRGSSTVETACRLSLAESTVQVYHKRLLSKTRSRSRSAMVAKILDWRTSRDEPGEREDVELRA